MISYIFCQYFISDVTDIGCEILMNIR